MTSEERGFTLVELMIASALAVIVLAASITVMRGTATAFARTAADRAERSELDDFAADLRRDAASAEAVSVSGDAAFPEVDFVEIGPDGRAVRWGYRFDGRVELLQQTGTAVLVNGMERITAFAASTLSVTELGDAANPYHAAFANMPPPIAYAFSIGGGTAGNNVVAVNLATAHERLTVHLIAGTAATGFGVERGALWHAVVWREAHTRRFALGLGQQSWYNIFGEVAYSDDQWNTSHVWCVHEIYDHLDVSDPRAQPAYHDASENASALFTACRQQTGQPTFPSPPAPGGSAVRQTL